MSDPISLATAREARQRPNANCIKRDDEGREMYLFCASYSYDYCTWVIKFLAYSEADAQARVKAMNCTLVVDGQVYAVIPR